jgi:uncharacterized DUF497 family protein
VDIEFDASKDDANRRKHGVPLALALMFDWDSVIATPDIRRDYGERRMVGYAVMDRRLYCVVYVERGRNIRIISLRKANRREVRRYEETH